MTFIIRNHRIREFNPNSQYATTRSHELHYIGTSTRVNVYARWKIAEIPQLKDVCHFSNFTYSLTLTLLLPLPRKKYILFSLRRSWCGPFAVIYHIHFGLWGFTGTRNRKRTPYNHRFACRFDRLFCCGIIIHLHTQKKAFGRIAHIYIYIYSECVKRLSMRISCSCHRSSRSLFLPQFQKHRAARQTWAYHEKQ